MGLNIMAIDDSPIIRGVIKKAILMCGVEVANVRDAEHGQDALDQLRTHPADVIFCDINMPVMNGVEFVRALRADDALGATPVIIISTDRSQGRREELERLGVSDYITKPFRPESIKAVLEKVTSESESDVVAASAASHAERPHA